MESRSWSPREPLQYRSMMLNKLERNEFSSNASFTEFCHALLARVRESLVGEDLTIAQKTFQGLLHKASANSDDAFLTRWGGVVVTSHRFPRISKYLIINAMNFLDYEWHKRKDETLHIVEGYGVILSKRDKSSNEFSAHFAGPHGTFHFPPGVEHCILAVTDMIILEDATDPMGMDKDLQFLFQYEGVGTQSSSADNENGGEAPL